MWCRIGWGPGGSSGTGQSGLCPSPLVPKALFLNTDIIQVSPKRQQIIEEDLEKGHWCWTQGSSGEERLDLGALAVLLC